MAASGRSSRLNGFDAGRFREAGWLMDRAELTNNTVYLASGCGLCRGRFVAVDRCLRAPPLFSTDGWVDLAPLAATSRTQMSASFHVQAGSRHRAETVIDPCGFGFDGLRRGLRWAGERPCRERRRRGRRRPSDVLPFYISALPRGRRKAAREKKRGEAARIYSWSRAAAQGVQVTVTS